MKRFEAYLEQMLQIVLGFIFGGLFLYFGGEALISGASSLARRYGISPLVIGLTVVAFGTSAPELAVSLQAALQGQSDIAVGNVVGSNIFNVLVILGLCAAIRPLAITAQLVKLDVPLMIGASVIMLLFSLDELIGRLEGLTLVSLLVCYNVFVVRKSRAESKVGKREYEKEYGTVSAGRRQGEIWDFGRIIGGLIIIVLGADWFVDSAVGLARVLGVSELIIGLTIVAAGTSLPEVTASIIATLRGERDIAVGNIVGSNIFNIFCVLGLTALIKPVGVSPVALQLDIPIMLGTAFACLPVFIKGTSIRRWEGWLFLGYYVVYVTYLIISANKVSYTETYGAAMLFFVLPLTAVTLCVLSFQDWKNGRKSPAK